MSEEEEESDIIAVESDKESMSELTKKVKGRGKGGPYKKPRKSSDTEESTVNASIAQLIQTAKQVQRIVESQVEEKKIPSEKHQAKRHFVEMLYYELMDLDDATALEFQIRTMEVLQQYKMRQQQPQPVLYSTAGIRISSIIG
ncbi:hypothetical protein SK128_014575, partial [Halocaridina rubra]